MYLDGSLRDCLIQQVSLVLDLALVSDIERGMSGSPVIDRNGCAVGVISSGVLGQPAGQATNIVACLPHWLGKSIDDVENAGEDDGQDEGAQQLSFIPSE